MTKERPEVRLHALADVRGFLGRAEQTVTQYQNVVSEAVRGTNLTAPFLVYNDALLSSLGSQPPLVVNVLPLEVVPRPTFRQKLTLRIRTEQPKPIKIEMFYPTTHDFFAYYSESYEYPPMIDLLPRAPLLSPQQIRERLAQEPETDERGRLQRYTPPLYGLSRGGLERGDDNTFVTIQRVGAGEDQFRLTPGITGTTKRIGGTDYNAGAGLFFIKSIATVNKDFFVIYSGNGMYKLLKADNRKSIRLHADPFKDKHSKGGDFPYWQGTAVGIDINLDNTEEFSLLLDLIRKSYSKAVKEERKAYNKAKFI